MSDSVDNFDNDELSVDNNQDNVLQSELLNKYLKVYKEGSIIYVEGQVSNTFFIFRRGRVRISNVGDNANFEKLITVIDEAGDFFGLEFVAEGNFEVRRVATAIATDKTEVLELPKEIFETVIKSKPVMGLKVVRSIVDRLYGLEKQLNLVGITDQFKRVIYALAVVSDFHRGGSNMSSIRRTVYENADSIAAWSAVDVETVKKVIRSLLDSGKIDVDREKIIVNNINECTRLATNK